MELPSRETRGKIMESPFALVGLALVTGGIALLLYIGYTAFLVMTAPNDVPIVRYVLEHLATGDRIIYGHGGRDTFELNVTQPVRTVTLVFLGIMIFGILAGIAKAIITAGMQLVRFGSEAGAATPHGAQPVAPIKRES